MISFPSHDRYGGFFLIRRNSIAVNCFHGVTDNAFSYWGVYPSYDPSNIFGNLNGNDINAFYPASTTVNNILVNLWLGSGPEYAVYVNDARQNTGPTSASTPVNSTIKLSKTDAFGSVVDTQPIHFIAASNRGIPPNKIAVLSSSIATLKS